MSYNQLRKGRFSQTGSIYHIIATTQNRIPYFSTLENGRCVVCEWIRLEAEAIAKTFCYVIMPDHLHWLCELQSGTLGETLRLLKGRSAKAIGGKIWQPNYYDRSIRKDDDLKIISRYIVANPLRAKLVRKIGDYSLWDAIWLEHSLDE